MRKHIFLLFIGIGCLFNVACIKEKNEYTFHYEKTILELPDDLKKNDSVSLVGLDDNSVYYNLVLDDRIRFYKNSDGELAELYTSEAEIVTYQEIYKGKLMLCEVDYTDTMTFSIKEIDSKNIYEIINGKCHGYPEIHLIGDYLLVGYSEKNDNCITQRLLQYNMDSYEIRELLCEEYVVDSNGNVTGILLQSFDGFESGFVLERIEFSNEDMYLDETGKTTLYYYDFVTATETELPIESKCKLTYVMGDETIVITSDYANKEPLYNTGNVYILKEGDVECITIEGVESGNDIVDVYKMSDDMLLIQTRMDVYIVDLDLHAYECLEGIRNAKVYEEFFVYLSQSNELVKCKLVK